jgi:hypothetical protein
MVRWSLVVTSDVGAWLASLGDDDFGRVAFYLDLLGQRDGRLAEPHSRPLRGRLRWLEVPGRRTTRRITYYLDSDHTVILLTVWRRWRPARQEVKRAVAALRRQPRRARTEGSCDGSPRPLG